MINRLVRRNWFFLHFRNNWGAKFITWVLNGTKLVLNHVTYDMYVPYHVQFKNLFDNFQMIFMDNVKKLNNNVYGFHCISWTMICICYLKWGKEALDYGRYSLISERLIDWDWYWADTIKTDREFSKQ